MNQTYETMDWDAEAKRVAAAFGLDMTAEYEFREFPEENPQTMLLRQIGAPKIVLPTRPETSFEYFIGAKGRIFVLSNNGNPNNGPVGARAMTLASLYWDGTIDITPFQLDSRYSEILARALFHLDLLTPEVEQALQVSVSAHEKIEWGRECEKRNGL